ncbi:hypothetical protein EZS27_022715 [termite gut metagenome]|uniref:Uncharacterized protein n=1 Tax=termite gut metagenome TaxID=433724 RepID=A0A5J4R515_9ZZZZ
MDDFLEKAMRKLNKMSQIEISEIEANFIRIMELTFNIFGKSNFRLPTEYSRGRINIAIMETIYYFFSCTDYNIIKSHKNEILKNHSLLISNSNYIDSVRFSTGSTNRVKNQFGLVIEILGNY